MAALIIGRWSPDLVAFGILLGLTLGHIITPEQAFAGFGSPVIIAVASIYVISAGLERTGAAALASRPLRIMAGRSYRRLLLILMLTTGLLAGFMNNLATVGVLLPVTVAVAYRRRLSPSRLLLPLVYAARFGGNLTLIAGPTNLLLADMLQTRRLGTLHLFDFLPIGLPMLVVGTAWMVAVGWRLLPARPPEELLRANRRGARLVKVYRLSERLFEAHVPPGSPLQGRTIEESEFGRTYGLTIVAVVRHGVQTLAPSKGLTLQVGDRLVIEGRLEELLQAEAIERIGLELDKAQAPSLDAFEAGIVEAIVAPRSGLAGRTLRDIGFRDRYSLTVLAVWREGHPIRTRFADIPLRDGDGLLIQGPRKALLALGGDRDLIIFEPASATGAERVTRRPYALLAIAVLIALTLAGVPVALAAALAAGIIVATGGLTTEEAYRAIDWRTLVLVGSVLPLGGALEQTGAARSAAAALVVALGHAPLATLAGILLAATVIGHVVPSIVLPVIFLPLAVDAATALGVSPLPFAMAIIAATGVGLLTPFSSPVMLMVMAPGGYRVRDYARAGLPIVLILLAIMMAVLPLAYPF